MVMNSISISLMLTVGVHKNDKIDMNVSILPAVQRWGFFSGVGMCSHLLPTKNGLTDFGLRDVFSRIILKISQHFLK